MTIHVNVELDVIKVRPESERITPRVIRNEEQYILYVCRLDDLSKLERQLTQDEIDEFDVLFLLIKDWERQNQFFNH